MGGWRQTKLIPLVLAGWFRPGLRRIARDVVTMQLNGNASARAHRYPWLKRLAMRMTAHPLRTLFSIILLYAAVTWLGERGWLPRIDLAIDPAASVRDFWTVNVGILGVQAALVGLVFPLVIAFVGLLNQGRSSFASRLTIYVESTAAVFVGISSLLLCLAIAIQLPIASRMTASAVAAATALNLLWLIANVAALAYFILRTIAFLHPARRAPILRAYVSNVVWPRELTEIVTRNRWDGAVTYGYLPQGREEDEDIFEPGHGARTWYSAMVDSGEPRVRKQLWKRKQLIDIKFAMIAPIVRNWLVEVGSLSADAQHDFVIPIDPGENYDGDATLVRATTTLGPISQLGLWMAFRFRTTREDHGAVKETAELLRELIADLLVLIDGRQAEEFAAQLTEVIEFHLFLYDLAQCRDEDFNYALIGSGHGVFGYGRTLGPFWVRAYHDVINRAVERLPDEPAFAARLAHAPHAIYGRAARTVMPRALAPLLVMAEILAYRLMNWAKGERAAEGGAEDAAPRPALTSRRGDHYAEAWREMVTGWERLLQVIATDPARREKKARTWGDFQRISENVIAHLRGTTEMSARAIWLGDETATRWTCDLMLHWNIQAERAWDTRGAYWRLESEGLTLELLDREWVEVEAVSAAPDGTPAPVALLFGAILRNAWRDHLVTLASLAIHWEMHGGGSATTLLAARMLLRNEPHDRGDFGGGGNEPLTGIDLLIAILRIQGVGARWIDRSYAGRFDHLLENLGQLGDAPWVSMRIYSSGGGLSFDALPRAQILAMMAISERPQGMNRELRRQLTQHHDESLQRRKTYLEALLSACGEVDAAQHGVVVAAIADLDLVGFGARLTHVRQLIEEALALLNGHRAQAIVDAAIDAERINALAEVAAEDAFARSRFPFNLFGAIEPTNEELTPFLLRATGLSKGSYTNPPMGQAAVNEDSWWRDAVAGQIAARVWWDVVAQGVFQELEGRTPEEFWRAVSEGSARIRESGQDPVLVLSSTAHPEWLRDWRWPHGPDVVPKPANLVITEALDQTEGYAFSLNDVPVYEAQAIYGLAYLLPSQLLARVRFHDFGGGRPVAMHFETDAVDPWTGTMVAAFQRAVELSALPAFQIRFANPLPPAADDEARANDGAAG